MFFTHFVINFQTFFLEQKFTEEIKILARKNSKLEEKIKLLQSKAVDKSQKRMLSKATLTESQYDTGASKEKILLQTEYLRRLNQPAYERVRNIKFFVLILFFLIICFRLKELETVQAELALREIEIDNLKGQLSFQQQSKAVSCSHTSISVQSAMSRMEREAEALKSKIEHMASEREELKQNLKEVLDDLHNEQLKYTSQIMQLTDHIKELENDNRFLRQSQKTGTSNECKVLRMTEKIDEYIQQLEELSSENHKLKTSYSQIK